MKKTTKILTVLLFSLWYLQSCTTEAPHSLEGAPDGLWVPNIATPSASFPSLLYVYLKSDSTKRATIDILPTTLYNDDEQKIIRSKDQIHLELGHFRFFINYSDDKLSLIRQYSIDTASIDTLYFVHRTKGIPEPYHCDSLISTVATSVWECQPEGEDKYYLFIEKSIARIKSLSTYKEQMGFLTTGIQLDSIHDEYIASIHPIHRYKYGLKMYFRIMDNVILVDFEPNDTLSVLDFRKNDYVVTQLDRNNMYLEPSGSFGYDYPSIKMTRVYPISNQVDTMLRYYEISKKMLDEAGMKY